MPFPDTAFDLVFTQMFFLWAGTESLPEIRRVLASGGHLLAAAEPDFGGAIAWPGPDRAIEAHIETLTREGADTRIARRLGAALEDAGFCVECGVHPAAPMTFAAAPTRFLYIPYFHFLATRR